MPNNSRENRSNRQKSNEKTNGKPIKEKIKLKQ